MNKASSILSSELLLPGFYRCLLACALCLIMVLPAKAQFNVYHPFPDSNAVWGMTSTCLDNMCGDGAYIQNYIAGDTLIDGYVYKQIHENYMSTSSNNCCYPPGDLGSGYLREDIAARKVYWRQTATASDTLLYDFTLVAGDTLRGLCAETTLVVESVDSILVGTTYRRRIIFTSYDSCLRTSMIEGIGSVSGLTACFFGPGEMGTSLSCFTVDGNAMYTAPCGNSNLVPCGELPVNIPGIFNKPKGLAASPNPSNGHFILNGIIKSSAVFVYNSTGQLVWQGSGTTIDLTGNPPGVYAAAVATERGSQAMRLVVVR